MSDTDDLNQKFLKVINDTINGVPETVTLSRESLKTLLIEFTIEINQIVMDFYNQQIEDEPGVRSESRE